MSTSTLLQVINTSLRFIGERPLINLSGTLANLASDCVEQTAKDLETMHQWEWLQIKVPANSWSTFTATLAPHQILTRVEVGDNLLGWTPLLEITPERFSNTPPTAYTGSGDFAREFAKVNDVQVWVNPYPSDVAAQARLRFWLQDVISVPTVATDTFANLPERMVPLFVKKLSYHLAAKHLNDMNLAAAMQGEFEQAVQQYRNREAGNTNRRLNMYGGNRGRW